MEILYAASSDEVWLWGEYPDNKSCISSNVVLDMGTVLEFWDKF